MAGLLLWMMALPAASCGAADDLASASDEITVSQVTVAPIHDGNALTLPAQRHLVVVGGTTLLALQQDGAQGRGLGFLRSDDGGQTWRYLAAIQNDWSHRDTADLLVVGNDVALVYSYEGPTLAGSVAHDVYFQWWRYRASDSQWLAQPRLRIFDSIHDTTGYYRAELARDSLGRIWVQAFKLETAGTSTARITVSSDGGTSFQTQPQLTSLAYRGGGRLASLGTSLIFLYDGHEAGLQPARFRLRRDAQPVGEWGPATVAFSEGIYHGAALSSAPDGDGGLHLVYKDKAQSLYYRHFDGTSFGARQLVDDAGAWELQPAVTRLGDDLGIFYNHVIVSSSFDEVRYRLLRDGVLGPAASLDASTSFKGYPAAVETLPTATATVPCIFGVTPDASSAGSARLYAVARAGALFSDDFNRTTVPDKGLGAAWSIGSGLWFSTGHAVSDHTGGDRVTEIIASCADCRVEATVFSYGVPETAIFLRAPSAATPDRYELVLAGDRDVIVRRIRGSVTTVLGRTSSGAGSLSEPVRLSLSASGGTPVTLTASVNGVERLSVTDGSSAALATGYAGLYTSNAGVGFDDFTLIE